MNGKKGERDGLITLLTIKERSDDPGYSGTMYPTSPRSIESLQRLGVDPMSLRSIKLDALLKKHKNKELAEIEHQFWMARRDNTFKELIGEREKLCNGERLG